jgi:uncharacterized protein with HEPN domain
VRVISERLLDIQDAIVRIMKYTREGRDRYDHDELVQTWVTHNLYIIGEAIRALASDFPEFKNQHPAIKWTEIIGMRTVLAHRYFDTDPDVLYGAPVLRFLFLLAVPTSRKPQGCSLRLLLSHDPSISPTAKNGPPGRAKRGARRETVSNP